MATIGNAPVFPTESVLPGNLQVTGNATVSGNATINGTTNSVGNLTENSNNVVNVADTGTITAGMLDGGQTGSAPSFAVRAWATYSGTTIAGSGNVSSITNHAIGDHTINFTTAMPNDDFAVGAITKTDSNTGFPYDRNESVASLAKGRLDSASSVRIVTMQNYGAPPSYHTNGSTRVIVVG